MASEPSNPAQEYSLGLIEVKIKPSQPTSTKEGKKAHKKNKTHLSIRKLHKKYPKLQVPTLIKLIDIDDTVTYYVLGLSEKGKKILIPILTHVESEVTPTKVNGNSLSLADQLHQIDFKKLSLVISSENNGDIYKTILSLQSDHSLFFALIHQYTQATVSALDSASTLERDTKICAATLKLGINLTAYFQIKGIVLSETNILNFIESISPSLLLQIPPNLFTCISLIKKFQDEAERFIYDHHSMNQSDLEVEQTNLAKALCLAANILSNLNKQKILKEKRKNGSPLNASPLTISKVLFYIFYTIPFPLAVLQSFIPLPKKGGNWQGFDKIFFLFFPPEKIIKRYNLKGKSEFIFRAFYTLSWIAVFSASPTLLKPVGVNIFAEFLSNGSYIANAIINVANFLEISPLLTLMIFTALLFMAYHQISSHAFHRYNQPNIPLLKESTDAARMKFLRSLSTPGIIKKLIGFLSSSPLYPTSKATQKQRGKEHPKTQLLPIPEATEEEEEEESDIIRTGSDKASPPVTPTSELSRITIDTNAEEGSVLPTDAEQPLLNNDKTDTSQAPERKHQCAPNQAPRMSSLPITAATLEEPSDLISPLPSPMSDDYSEGDEGKYNQLLLESFASSGLSSPDLTPINGVNSLTPSHASFSPELVDDNVHAHIQSNSPTPTSLYLPSIFTPKSSDDDFGFEEYKAHAPAHDSVHASFSSLSNSKQFTAKKCEADTPPSSSNSPINSFSKLEQTPKSQFFFSSLKGECKLEPHPYLVTTTSSSPTNGSTQPRSTRTTNYYSSSFFLAETRKKQLTSSLEEQSDLQLKESKSYVPTPLDLSLL